MGRGYLLRTDLLRQLVFTECSYTAHCSYMTAVRETDTKGIAIGIVRPRNC